MHFSYAAVFLGLLSMGVLAETAEIYQGTCKVATGKCAVHSPPGPGRPITTVKNCPAHGQPHHCTADGRACNWSTTTGKVVCS
ncbi:hypothetical protein BT63DRAFT_451599 [Microthyrium microscopicum]|uniref:Uncharacterized protein n=1 Tax=Microthyrium microscopicum TaxID=703497 RepID=A0A6A6UP53_9PEZI|nr:hypothetical protein BT63DRAFT_451599 [Microthyrium microscopicum]